MRSRCCVALLCGAAWTATAATPAPAITFSTFLGLADCDGVAALAGRGLPGVSLTGEPLADSGERLQAGFGDDERVRAPRESEQGHARLCHPRRWRWLHGRFPDQGRPGRLRLTWLASPRRTTFRRLRTRCNASSAAAIATPSSSRLRPRGPSSTRPCSVAAAAIKGTGLELDGIGVMLYVGGTTWSNDFPGERSPRATGDGDAFISYLRPADPGSLRTTLLGGAREE